MCGPRKNKEKPRRWSAECLLDHKESTHLFIVEAALASLPLQNSATVQLYRFMPEWASGLFDADHLNPYYDCASFTSHFYDPNTGLNYCGDISPTAFTECVRFYEEAVRLWTSLPSRPNESLYNLGLALHYLTDLTQPMHAANFTAKSSPVKYHSEFEIFITEYCVSIDPKSPGSLGATSCLGTYDVTEACNFFAMNPDDLSSITMNVTSTKAPTIFLAQLDPLSPSLAPPTTFSFTPNQPFTVSWNTTNANTNQGNKDMTFSVNAQGNLALHGTQLVCPYVTPLWMSDSEVAKQFDAWVSKDLYSFVQDVAVESYSQMPKLLTPDIVTAFKSGDTAMWHSLVEPVALQQLRFAQGVTTMFLRKFVDEVGGLDAANEVQPWSPLQLNRYARDYGEANCQLQPDRCNGIEFARCALKFGKHVGHLETRSLVQMDNAGVTIEPCMVSAPSLMCGDDTGTGWLPSGCGGDAECEFVPGIVIGANGGFCNPKLCGNSNLCKATGIGTAGTIATCWNPEAPQCVKDEDCDSTSGVSTDPHRAGRNCNFVANASTRQFYCSTPMVQCQSNSQCSISASKGSWCQSTTPADYKCAFSPSFGNLCRCNRVIPDTTIDYRGP